MKKFIFFTFCVFFFCIFLGSPGDFFSKNLEDLERSRQDLSEDNRRHIILRVLEPSLKNYGTNKKNFNKTM